MDFQNVPKEYRSIPFWSWNEKLVPEETAEQVRIMKSMQTRLKDFLLMSHRFQETEFPGALFLKRSTKTDTEKIF